MVMNAALRRQILVATAACVASVLFSYAFVDRPLATFVHGYFPNPHVFVIVAHYLSPLMSLATLGVVVLALAYFTAWRLHPNVRAVLRVLLVAAVATCAAMCVKDEFKWMIGRTWPDTIFWHNPSWIQNGVYAFSPFHGGLGWEAFPSGHTTIVTAIAAVFMRAFPRRRVLWMLPVVLTSVGLVAFGIHWLSDVIAGVYLGAVCGFGIASLMAVEPVVFEPAALEQGAEATPAPDEAAAHEPAE
jgi:membrane-associated phospholipid phosphatase